MQMTDYQCAMCGVSFAAEDTVLVNGTPEQVQALRDRLEARKAAKKLKNAAGKKSKSKTAKISQTAMKLQETTCAL